jgi:hypothetical protein
VGQPADAGKKTGVIFVIFSHLKMIVLPRQAREGQTQGKTTQKHAHAGGGRRERAQHEVDAGEKKERNSPSFFFALLVDEMRR